MAFVKPQLNILGNMWFNANWRGLWPAFGNPPSYANFPCQLRPGCKNFTVTSSLVEATSVQELCVDLSVDWTMPAFQTAEWPAWPDIVEVPAGSECWYFVLDVADVGRGFMNQHRVLLIAKTSVYGYFALGGGALWPYAPTWPDPIP